MTSPRRRFVLLAAGSAALFSAVLLTDVSAWSQASRVIKVVVPVPPGGGLDFLVRLLAEQLAGPKV